MLRRLIVWKNRIKSEHQQVNPLVPRVQKNKNPQINFNWLLLVSFDKEIVDFTLTIINFKG